MRPSLLSFVFPLVALAATVSLSREVCHVVFPFICRSYFISPQWHQLTLVLATEVPLAATSPTGATSNAGRILFGSRTDQR